LLDFDLIEWDDESDPRGNTRHIADNGLTPEEVEAVLCDPASRPGVSRSTGRPVVFGTTPTGKTIIVIYERRKDGRDVIIRPVTAYEIG
jgi:hypothetical protein